MASNGVVAAVDAKLAVDWTSCPVIDGALTGEPPAGAFLVVQYPVASEDQISIGAPGAQLFREEGAIRFVFSFTRGSSPSLARAMANDLRTLFRAKKFDGVNTWAPSPPVEDDSNTRGNRWMLSFSVPYYFDSLA